MNILVFDTCFNKSYIVLKKDSLVFDYVIESDEKNYHSAYLIPKIRDILKSNSIFVKDLDAIGVNIGPGSFTGIRAGVTIARVLAQQADIKLIGADSLQILSNLTDSPHVVVVMDARKNKVYFSEFKDNKQIIFPSLVEKDMLMEKISQDASVIADASISSFLKEKGFDVLNFDESSKNLGLYLCDIVQEKLKDSSNDFHWAKVKPLYIQPPSITKSKRNL